MSVLVYILTIPDGTQYLREVIDGCAVEAVIFTFTPPDPDLINSLPKRLPVVLLGEKDEQVHRDTLSLNSYDAGKLLVYHLHDIGHRHIGFISGPDKDKSRATNRRLTGVRSAMQKLGLEDQLVVMFGSGENESRSFDAVVQSGAEVTRRMLAEHPEVTAIIGVDDMTCVGVHQASRAVRPPDGVLVCGFDDTYIARAWHFTSIDHGVFMRVKMALDLVQQRTDEPVAAIPPHKSESQPYLIIRNQETQ